MKLDLPSLALVTGLTCFAQVAALAIQFRTNRACRGVGWWLGSSAAIASGFLLLLLGTVDSIEMIGIFGNPMLMLGHLAQWLGTCRFLGRPEHRARSVSALAVTVTAYYIFLFPIPSIVARAVVVSGTIALFDLATARALLVPPDRRFLQSARFTAATFLAHGCFLLAVAGTTLARAPIQVYQEFSLLLDLAFVVPAVASTLWTFGFILMLNQRLGSELLESLTEWRRTEREKTGLAIRNRQLEKAESLARMAGAIAHHYNNHLQAVLGNLELLEAAVPEDMAGGSLARAKRATERATELSRLMLVSLGQAGQDQAMQDLGALCRNRLPSIQAALPAQVRLQADLPDPGPAVRADANQIRLALDNLTRNAQEALGEAGGELRIRVGAGPREAIPARHRFPVDWQPQAPDYAWLEVSDTGPGIPPANLEKLCDPFYSTKFTGRGLGLPVALGIAQAHGGGLTVASRPGEGSAFRIHIPVEPAPEGT